MLRRAFIGSGVKSLAAVAALPLLPGCGGEDAAPGQLARKSGTQLPATPRTYRAASGTTVYGGLFGTNPLLELIAAAPANSWIQVNQNRLESVFPPLDFVPLTTVSGPGQPTSVMRAWSSFAWDPARSRLIIYGGGHANYDGNEVYVFDGLTGQWSLAFWPSDVVDYDWSHGERITIDGPLHSPVSAHTYDNNAYLEVLDRFITFGGAAAHTGGPYVIHGDGPDRACGPYTLDLTLAGQGMVGGLPGSNVHRGSSLNVNLDGANAWAVRDYHKDHPDPNNVLFYMTFHLSSGTAYARENGHDVLYLTSRPGLRLHRIEFVDQDYRNDLITLAGYVINPPQYDNTLALDPVQRIIVTPGEVSLGIYLWGWDISGAPKGNFEVRAGGLTGPGASAFIAAFKQKHGIDFDTLNNRFVLWSEGGQVFGVSHSGTSFDSDWYVEELRANTGTAGVDRPKTREELDAEPYGVYSKSDTSTLGKWKWARDLNAFVGLQHCYYGNVWIYKPANWVAPSAVRPAASI